MTNADNLLRAREHGQRARKAGDPFSPTGAELHVLARCAGFLTWAEMPAGDRRVLVDEWERGWRHG